MSAMKRSGWKRRVFHVLMLVNVALAAEMASVPVFASGAALGLFWYAGRRLGWDFNWLAAAGASIVLAAGVACFLGRKRFFDGRDAAAFLDEQMGLQAALSAGRQWGNAVAPPAVPEKRAPLRWRWSPDWLWLSGGAALALAGALLPLPPQEAQVGESFLPLPLAQVSETLQSLEQMESVDAESVRPFREQLDALAGMNKEAMYSHAGLEAADALREKTAGALSGLRGGIARTGEALSSLENGAGDDDGAEAWASLQESLRALNACELQPGGVLGDRLRELAASSPRQLDAEALRALRRGLEESAERLGEACGRCGMAAIAVPDENAPASPGLGDGMGQGGLGRGRADAPLAFRREMYQPLETTARRAESQGWSRAALGDRAGVEVGAPVLEEDARNRENGGTVSGAARGGEAVWEDELTPREQSALKAIFL